VCLCCYYSCCCLCTVGVDRQGLTAFLTDEAARRFPESITFHFGVKPDLDLAARRVRFVSQGSNQRAGSPLEVAYDLLVGADGAGSSVRAALEQEAAADVKVRERGTTAGRMLAL
jgi:2-polyprenyl-6-methoxyphenol hydroxylase-like FAD-dependent oxidoreductase